MCNEKKESGDTAYVYYYLVNDILFLPPIGFGCKNQKSLVLVMCMRVCVTSEIN